MEVYDSNKIEAVVFHADPKCDLSCEGCYLRPHGVRINDHDPEFLGTGLQLVKKAAKELLSLKGFHANQVIFACNTMEQITDAWEMYSDTFFDSTRQVQILASFPEWQKLREKNQKLFKRITSLRADWLNKPQFISACSIDVNKKKVLLSDYNFSYRDWSYTNILCTDPELTELERLVSIPSDLNWFVAGNSGAYLMLHKPLCGQKPSAKQISQGQRLYKLYNKLQATDDSIVIDKCLGWSVMEQEFGCHAGVNLINIHADGALTGCPYSLEVKTYLHDHQNIGEAINYVRELANSGEDYDWDRCKIKEVDWANEN